MNSAAIKVGSGRGFRGMNHRNTHARTVQNRNVESDVLLERLRDMMRGCGPDATAADAQAATELRDGLLGLVASLTKVSK